MVGEKKRHPQEISAAIYFMFQFFKLSTTDDNEHALSAEDYYDNLLDIVENSLDKDIPVGILTSENRDVWAESYQLLEEGNTRRVALYLMGEM